MFDKIVHMSVTDLFTTAQQIVYKMVTELDENFGLTVTVDEELIQVEDRELFESRIKEYFYSELYRMFGIEDDVFFELFEVKVIYTPKGDN